MVIRIEFPKIRLGSSDLQVGRIAYGCWRLANVSLMAARRNIETAVRCGMTLIDTADVYGKNSPRNLGDAEEILGKILAQDPALRTQITVATKGGIAPGVRYDSRARYIQSACEASLNRLQVDVIDLYQIHRPDVLTHPEEVARALADLRQTGKVREVGVSNYSASQLSAIQSFLPFPLTAVQPELSLMNLHAVHDGVLDHCMASGATPLAWSPLAGGRLVAQPASVRIPPKLTRQIKNLAERESVSSAAICIAFLLALPAGVVPIIGTQRPERISEIAAAANVVLDNDDCYKLMASAGQHFP